MTRFAATILIAVAAPTVAAAQAGLHAHEHGVSALDIAIDGEHVEMALRAPAADIVGFEYAPETDADREAIHEALEALEDPLALFTPPAGAGCALVSAEASFTGEAHEDHDAHGDDDDHHDEAHHDGDEHADEEHAHEEHADDDHDHDGADAEHSDFEAAYVLDCSDAASATQFDLSGFFARFAGASEVDGRLISASGQFAAEAERDTPTLNFD